MRSIEAIYRLHREALLAGYTSEKTPKAILLGGQPSSGKGALAERVKEQYPSRKFLSVNGDLFRRFHPNFNRLQKDPSTFSERTQSFSNFFTESLIQEAITNKYSIIVEGTMRTPDTTINTAKAFKHAGFEMEAYVISAPAEITRLNLAKRYVEEIRKQGYGRLADSASHDRAVDGIPQTLDRLYAEQPVDRISIYGLFAEKGIKTYTLTPGGWSDKSTPPSAVLLHYRELQRRDLALLKELIDGSQELLKSPTLSEADKTLIATPLEGVKNLYQEAIKGRENKTRPQPFGMEF